jgi:WD40 repeat protein
MIPPFRCGAFFQENKRRNSASTPPQRSETKPTTYRGHTHFVFAVAWSPDGESIASICSSDVVNRQKVVHIWNVTNGQELFRYPMHSGLSNGVLTEASALAWSPDGIYIASTCGDKTIHIWNAITGKQIATWRVDAELTLAITWSPDSKQIAVATAGSKSAVRVWNMARKEMVLTYGGHTKDVRTVAWSPDGKYIASGGHDETVHVWDATSGVAIPTPRHHSSWVTSVAWSPDGTRIASGSHDKTVRVWQVSNEHSG